MQFAHDIIFNLNNTKIYCTDFIHFNQSTAVNLNNPTFTTHLSSLKIVDFFKENTTLHKHYSIEFQFILKGKLKISANNQEYVVSPGNLIVIPSNINHCCFDISDNFERFSFLFSIESLKKPFGPEFSYLQPLAEHDKLEILPFDTSAIIYLQNIYDNLKDSPSIHNSQISHSMLTILLFNLRKQIIADKDTLHYFKTYDSLVQRKSKIEHFLYSKKGEKLSLKDLAKFLGLSERQTSRIVINYFNLTFSQLSTKIKMEQAIYLIENTNLTCKDVSESLGYETYYTFYNAYKKFWGSPPSKGAKTNK